MEIIQKISSKDLKPGMILAKDIIINELKLLTKGLEITSQIADRIKTQFPLTTIYIYIEDSPKNEELFKKRNSVKFKKTQEQFLQLTKAAETLFSETIKSDTVNMHDVRSICDIVNNQLTDAGIVLKNIIEEEKIDNYLYRHSINVSALCTLTGKWLKLDEKDILLLTYSGMLHDIGKCKIPYKIINKPGPLTNEEYLICQNHTKYGYEAIKKVPYLDPSVAVGILLHHERQDGSGYPLGLKGDKIPLFAKIISIADIFDAMTSNRVYRSRICPLDVLMEISDEIFSKLDPAIATVFLSNIINYYIGEIALFNDGRLGKIIKLNINNITQPWVEVDGELIDLSKDKTLKIADIL